MAKEFDRQFDTVDVPTGHTRTGGPTAFSVPTGDNTFGRRWSTSGMVVETERDGTTWHECEHCGLMFDDDQEAAQHEEACDAEDPSYLQ